MEHEARATSVSPSEKTIPLDRERTLVAPRFDDKSVQRARPAVPIARGRASRFGSNAVLVACVVAGLLGGMGGGLALLLYQKRNAATTTQQSAAIVVNNAEPASPSSTSTPTSTPNTSPVVTPNDEPETNAASTSPSSSTDSSSSVAELRGALDEWIAATNARDLGRQMSFYGETIAAFYRTRNVSRAAVRAEKLRVFGAAQTIDIRAAEPDVRLGPDGQTAVMRFRKKYNIEGGGQDRRGEVLQELRWRRTPDGWKIVSERDLRVLD